MAETISIGICDDHGLVRSGLRRVLEAEEGFEVTGEAGTADEALALVRDRLPDVLLLDVTMPGRSGIDALPELIEARPGMKILMLSMQDDPAYVRSAFTAGAHGYLLKDAADADLVKALHEVVNGHRYVHPALGARLVSTEISEIRDLDDPLSEREHEVLRLLALGHTNQEIAKELFISVRTAESHRAKIGEKLGLRTRAELVRYALDTGMLDTAPATARV
jgi:two-component system, NarL family, response regulator NreC